MKTARSTKPVTKTRQKPAPFVDSCNFEIDWEDGGLPEMEKVLCLHYLRTGNGAEAARLAGYSTATAKLKANAVLKSEAGKAFMKKLKDDVAKVLFLNAVNLADKYLTILSATVKDLIDENGLLKNISEVDDRTAWAIKSIEFKKGQTVRIEMMDKIQALNALTKMIGVNGSEKVDLNIKPAGVDEEVRRAVYIDDIEDAEVISQTNNEA